MATAMTMPDNRPTHAARRRRRRSGRPIRPATIDWIRDSTLPVPTKARRSPGRQTGRVGSRSGSAAPTARLGRSSTPARTYRAHQPGLGQLPALALAVLVGSHLAKTVERHSGVRHVGVDDGIGRVGDRRSNDTTTTSSIGSLPATTSSRRSRLRTARSDTRARSARSRSGRDRRQPRTPGACGRWPARRRRRCSRTPSPAAVGTTSSIRSPPVAGMARAFATADATIRDWWRHDATVRPRGQFCRARHHRP